MVLAKLSFHYPKDEPSVFVLLIIVSKGNEINLKSSALHGRGTFPLVMNNHKC
jgi:hypothetical protein